MAYERPHLQQVISRISEPRRFIQVLYGPRQVGKTTLIRQALESLDIPSLFASADMISSGHTWIEQQWEAARIRVSRDAPKEFILVIDEVQKIDNWSEAVKRQWDEDTRTNCPIKLVLLGSSRLLLQQGLTESLAGRFETIYMGHWTFTEMKQAFGFTPEQFVWFGGYPGAASLVLDEDRWKRYVHDSLIETSISRDILLLTRVDKPALMRRLFELGCASSGQIISFTKILGQLQDAGNTVTLAHYLSLLDTAGLLAGLNKYAGRQHRQRSSSPKFQVHNTALLSAQQAYSFTEVMETPSLWGRWVESAVGAYLLNEALTHSFSLRYWRDRNEEVDFILEKGQRIVAIEVKTSPVKQTKGMTTFSRQWQPYKALKVGKDGLSWQEFLTLSIKDIF